MANSSIHIEAGENGFFAHNSRETKTKNSIFDDEENFVSCTKDEAFKIYRNELKIRSEAYTERTKQKLQKNTITHLSAIVNLNKHHTEYDLKLVCDYLEQTLDTKIIQYAIHRDEGHYVNYATDEIRKRQAVLNDEIKIKNYHAHIEFMALDSKGNSIRRKLTKKYFSNLQTKTAELLNMQRGRRTMIDNPQDYYNQIIKEMPKTDNLQDFKKEYIRTGKKIRYRDKPKSKRKSTQHYKNDKEQEANQQIIARQKDLKIEIAKLREQLKEAGAVREDYAKLEQLNRELKEQIKHKELSIEDLIKHIDSLKAKNEDLEYKIIMSSNGIYEKEINNLEKEIKLLKNTNKENPKKIEALEKDNKYKDVQIQVLKDRINDLKKENKQFKDYGYDNTRTKPRY